MAQGTHLAERVKALRFRKGERLLRYGPTVRRQVEAHRGILAGWGNAFQAKPQRNRIESGTTGLPVGLKNITAGPELSSFAV